MNIPARKEAVEVFYNTKEKRYPCGMSKITVCSKAIFRNPDYKPVERLTKAAQTTELQRFITNCMKLGVNLEVIKEVPDQLEKPKKENKEVRDDNLKRAKEKVFDIAFLNQFDYFVTWTLDKEKIDRYNPQEVSKKLKTFLNNMQKRKNMKYLVIPEHHKDGAIHMHGLVSGDFKLIDSGKKTESGRTIYNMADWSWGFSTAIETYGESTAVAKYITKYITKDFKMIFGNFYYAGGKIVRHAPTQLYDVDYNTVNEQEFYVQPAQRGFKYMTVERVGEDDFNWDMI